MCCSLLSNTRRTLTSHFTLKIIIHARQSNIYVQRPNKPKTKHLCRPSNSWSIHLTSVWFISFLHCRKALNNEMLPQITLLKNVPSKQSEMEFKWNRVKRLMYRDQCQGLRVEPSATGRGDVWLIDQAMSLHSRLYGPV